MSVVLAFFPPLLMLFIASLLSPPIVTWKESGSRGTVLAASRLHVSLLIPFDHPVVKRLLHHVVQIRVGLVWMICLQPSPVQVLILDQPAMLDLIGIEM